ncbi:MAG: protein kinase domain-containing protein, partial [Gemmataceae bacterium]
MRRRPLEPSVARLLSLLPRSRLVTGREVDDLKGRWLGAAARPDDVAAFSRWLVEQGYVTEFQLALLLHDHPDHFFLGPYKLLERVGRGRLATVYKAVHRLGHLVALKVLPPTRARDPRLVARFRQEAELARRMDHPNVVRVLEGGHDGGVHYLAMEYLRGMTLEEVLQRRGRLP